MTASSQFGDGYQPAYGRLNGDRGDGWCAKTSSSSEDWLQVDLGRTLEVCAVATQGDRNGNEWVTDFKLSYSSDGNVWTPYKDANGGEVVRDCTVHLQYWFIVIAGHTITFIKTMRCSGYDQKRINRTLTANSSSCIYIRGFRLRIIRFSFLLKGISQGRR